MSPVEILAITAMACGTTMGTIALRVLDLAFGNRVSVKLLNGKDVVFTVPPKTGNGAIFRFKGGGKDGRDLHLKVLSNEQDGAK